MSEVTDKLLGTLVFVSSIALWNINRTEVADLKTSKRQTAPLDEQKQEYTQTDVTLPTPSIVKTKDTSTSSIVLQGRDVLQHLLSLSLYVSSPLADPNVFYEWAMNAIRSNCESNRSNEFQKRQNLLELAYLHEKEISVAEDCEARAMLAWQTHPQYQIHETLAKQIDLTRKALLQMNAQLQKNQTKEKLSSLRTLLKEKEQLQNDLEMKSAPLQQINEYQAFLQTALQHEQLLYNLGITSASEELASLQHTTGVRRSKGGFKFEDEAAKVVQDELLVKIASQHQVPVSSLMIVRNITFQMASLDGSPGEIDMLVCMKEGEGRDHPLAVHTLDNADKNGRNTKKVVIQLESLKKNKKNMLYFDAQVLAVIEVSAAPKPLLLIF
jgi:hypothetical protein